MALRIVRGRAGSGKSSFCIDEISKIAKNGGKAVYIVPEQYSHEAESQIADSVGYVSDRILATSFKRLSFSILKKCVGNEVYADSRFKNILMAKTLTDISSSLKIFAAASKSAGFIEKLIDVISEFKRSVCTPDDVEKCADNITDNDFFAEKLKELALIYKRYNESFGELSDTADSITKAAEFIREYDNLKGAKIYIDEFFRFTRQEMLFIGALLLEGLDVTVTLGYIESSNDGGVFAPALNTQNRILSLLSSCSENFLGFLDLTEQKRFSSPELLHLSKQFVSYPPEVYNEKTNDILLTSAPDVYTELVQVASRIDRLVKTQGYSYSDIGIIAGNIERYEDVAPAVFADYDIPLFIDTKECILSHPIMLMLFSVFDIITGGFDTKDILSYIKTGLSPISMVAADMLENHAYSAGLKRGAWLDDARFVRMAKSVFSSENDLSEAKQQELLEIRDNALAPIVNLKNRFAKSNELSNRIAAIRKFFDEICIEDKIRSIEEELLNIGDSQRAAEYKSVYGVLDETLMQLEKYLGTSKLGLERLKTVLSAGFGGVSMGVVPTEYDQVLIGDENRSVVGNIKALFIIGANAGAFPMDIVQGGVFSDGERIFLEKQGLELAPDSTKRILDSRFQVYTTLSAPKEKLFISYSVSDFDGKGLRPSQLISSIKRIFPNLTKEDCLETDEGISKAYVSGKKSAYNYVLGCMAAGKENVTSKKLTDFLSGDEIYRGKIKQVEERINSDYRPHRLTKESVSGLYGEKLYGSVTRFENFSNCPFSYFVKYGLRAKERQSVSLEATDSGSLLHLVIELFSKKVYEEGKSFAKISKEECKTAINEIIDEQIFGSFISNLYGKEKLAALTNRLKGLAERSAWAICEHVRQGKFEPQEFEFSFDENGDTPPIKIPLPNGAEIVMVGKIDRVDTYCADDKIYVKIIDYKSGNKSFSLSDIINKTTLQLTVYLTAYLAADPKREPAGMFYFRLSDPIAAAQKGINEENVEDEIMKKYKMSGLVLSDIELISAMEDKKSGYFSTIPVMLKKDGTISEGKSSCASAEEFRVLKDYVNQTLVDIGEEIFSGNVDISPIKNGKKTACDFCKFSSICGGGKYTELNFRDAYSLKSQEAFSFMRKELDESRI